jgi:hypothetical protein
MKTWISMPSAPKSNVDITIVCQVTEILKVQTLRSLRHHTYPKKSMQLSFVCRVTGVQLFFIQFECHEDKKIAINGVLMVVPHYPGHVERDTVKLELTR